MQPQIPDHIRQLADKWINGNITTAERDALLEWYARKTPGEISWESADTDEKALEDRLYFALQTRLAPRLKPVKMSAGKRFARAAAALLLIAAGWAGINKWQQGKITTVTADGGIKRMILPDSSIVWLKGNSSISWQATFGKKDRQVILKGEGLFEIKKDPTHPFVVESGEYTTQVLGTSFNIKEHAGNHPFSLLVLTGKVQVVKKSNRKDIAAPLLITPDYQFMGDSRQASVSKVSTADREQTVNGTEYDMNFNHTAFPEIIQRVEHKFDVKFKGNYQQFEGCHVTADVTDQSLSNSLKLLTMAVNASYDIKDGVITITGSGCK
ncbi:FecR family protein [Chitinophaga sp. Ak27]|uniref:FecR family protein n=1 Tax=Chitinophaga sp. Ak27 TaxID=2726116 RepID=UPI00145FA2E7|nr:FecR family protein [Chitinophaga sp. Ak27]NLU90470.1 FecR family protein [Chitinophaga sp. Ak27]